MEATFHISTDELDEHLIHQIKKLFEGKSVQITITTESNDTTYLLADPANKQHLLDSMASEPQITYTAEEFERKAKALLKDADTNKDQ